VINIDSIAQALLVAEHLSFSRAAQVLGVRQSEVSRRVRALAKIIPTRSFPAACW
jgi:DNA-binding transcriptional LysR family regulator